MRMCNRMHGTRAGAWPSSHWKLADSTHQRWRFFLSAALMFSLAIFRYAVYGFESNSLSSFAILRSEEHTSELQSLMRISYAVFCLNKKKQKKQTNHSQQT